jgi:hypothetical protein
MTACTKMPLLMRWSPMEGYGVSAGCRVELDPFLRGSEVHGAEDVVLHDVHAEDGEDCKGRLCIQLRKLALDVHVHIRFALKMRHHRGALREELGIRERAPNEAL